MKKIYPFMIMMLLCGAAQAQLDSLQQIPATVPYSCDFSNQSENARWILSRYPAPASTLFYNHFVIGTGTSVTGLPDDNSLYVSRDTAGSYISLGESCQLFAERLIDFGAGGTFDLEFDWKASGCTPTYYQSAGMKVFLRDTSDLMPAGTPSYANEHLDYALYDNSWRHGHVNLGYVTGVKTLQFYTWGYNTSQASQVPAAVDNISVYASDCWPPSFTLMLDTSAVTFQWQGSPSDTFLIVYRPESGSYSDNVYDTVTGSSYAVTGMIPNTPYVAWMARFCDGHASALSDAFHFVTPCMTYIAPFLETFSTDANCWSWDNDFFSLQNGFIYTTAYNPYNPILAVSPIINASGLSHPYLRFLHYQPDFQGYHKNVAVYYRDNAQDSWHKLGTYVRPTATWVTDSLALPSNSPTLQLAFEGVGSAYNTRANFDDICVYDGPACPVVSEIVYAGTDSNGDVIVTWIGAPGYSYDVRYRKASDTVWTLYGGVVTEEVTLPDLESLTSYIVEIATLCDSMEEYHIQGTFTTPLLPVNLPYTTDFSPSSDRKWALDNSTCASYWMMGTPGTGTWSNALFVTQDGTTAGYNNNSYSTVCAYKNFNVNEGPTVFLEFDVQVGGQSTNSYLKAFWVPDSVEFPASTGTPQYAQITYLDGALSFADYVGQTGDPTTYKLNLTNGNILHVNVELPNVTPLGTSKLVFVWRNTSHTGVQPGAIISNVHVWQPSCYTVYDLNVPTTFLDTAVVEWQSYSSTAPYILQYKPQNMSWTDPGVVSMDVAGKDTVLTGLLSQTLYDLRVAMNCGTDTAEWKNISFRSGCEVVTVTDTTPFLETFSVDPECWKKSINPWHEWFYVVSGKFTHTHVFPGADSCGLVSPVFDISGLTRPYLSLDHYQNGNDHSDNLGIYYRTSALDGWHPWTLFTQTISSAHKDSLPLPQQTGLIQLAFFSMSVPGGGSVLIDNVALFNGPECPPIYYLEADGVTADSATITWLGFSENGYVIRYRHLPDTNWIFYDTTYDQYYIFDGLQGSKNYQVQVSSVCSGSYYKSVFFSTPLSVEELPYYTDFSPTEDRDWKLNKGNCNNYWMIGQTDTTSDAQYALFITNDGETPGYHVGFSTVTAEKLFHIGTTPEITVDLDILVGGESKYDYFKMFLATENTEFEPTTAMPNSMNFPWYMMTSSYGYGDYNFSAYKPLTGYQQYPYIFNQTNGNVIHISATMPNPYQSYNVNAASNAKLVFAWTNDNSDFPQPGAIIYNVSVHTNNCDPVSNLTISDLHPTSATFTWTPGNVETTWNVDYKEPSATSWIPNAVNSPTFTLTNLQPETEYYVRVQADCDDGDVSNYEMLSFFTPSCETADQCEYTLVLTDSWGDGWSGGRLYVYQNGVKIMDTAAVSHPVQHVTSYDTVSLSLCHGTDVRLVWSSGNMYNECGVIFLSPEGSTMYQISSLFSTLFGGDSTLYAFTADCPVIEPVVVTDSVSLIGTNSATFHGHIADLGNQPIINQGFEWKMVSEAGYNHSTDVTGDPMVYTASDLHHSTQYVFRAFVATDNAAYYGSEISFTTEVGPCPTPSDLHVTDSTGNSLTIAWTENGDAEQWNIQYRTVGGALSYGTSNVPSYEITGLEPATTYEFQVQSVCDTSTSEWTEVATATTTTGITDYSRHVRVYPNPTQDFINVECTLDNVPGDGISVEVVDVYGKVVRTVVVVNHDSPLQTRINVSSLAAGMYFVRVATEAGVITKPFVKQ